MCTKSHQHQSGNVLFLILIAVALFAALSYAVTQSGRSGGGDASAEKNAIIASELLQYSTALRTAITRMQISNRCEDTDLSFERAPFNGSDPCYVNPNNTSNFSCFVFHPDGGGVPEGIPPQDGVATENGVTGFSECTDKYFYDARRIINGIGLDTPSASANEVTVRLQVTQGICESINENISGSRSIPTDDFHFWFPVRDITSTLALSGLNCSDDACRNKDTFCFLQTDGANDVHQFYSVIVER